MSSADDNSVTVRAIRSACLMSRNRPSLAWDNSPLILLWIALGAILLIAWFAALGDRPLVAPDEGRYGAIALEMAQSADWVTPRLNGLKYFEKPPLQYWVTAAFVRWLGIGEISIRMWPALAGLLGVLATIVAAGRLHDRRTALFAGLMLASSVLWGGTARFVTLDVGVSTFLSITIFALALGMRDGMDERGRTRWLLLAWFASALAVLSKGLIGIVLPGAALLSYAIVERDAGVLRKLRIDIGLPLHLCLVLPWFVAVSLANPEFPSFFFVQEHIERFFASGHGRGGPWWYYAPILLIGFAPWLPLTAAALPGAWRANACRHFRPMRFLVVWTAVVLLFFTVSKSKLPPYVLPVWPALAVIAAHAAACGARRPLGASALFALSMGVLIAAVAAFNLLAHVVAWVPAELLAIGSTNLAIGALALAGSAGLSLVALARRRDTVAILSLATGGIALVHFAFGAFAVVAPALSSASLITAARPTLSPDVPVFALNHFDQTQPFYLQRPVTLIGAPGETAPGARWEPGRFVSDEQTFLKDWWSLDQAAAILLRPDYLRLADLDVPMVVVAEDWRRMLVLKR